MMSRCLDWEEGIVGDADVPVSICAEAEETIYSSDAIRGKAAR